VEPLVDRNQCLLSLHAALQAAQPFALVARLLRLRLGATCGKEGHQDDNGSESCDAISLPHRRTPWQSGSVYCARAKRKTPTGFPAGVLYLPRDALVRSVPAC